MSKHWAFFKEGDTSFGTFYPRHYIVAGYRNLADAEAAEHALRDAGAPPEDVRAATGEFVTGQLESRHGANWLERMEQRLVEFAGTETGYIREDADLARDGGAFLFVYAPDDQRVAQARRVFAQIGPAYARRYLDVAIERIVENAHAP
ncbi:MAG TPA: hypothetical protein VN725_03260 [Rhodanobacteraceae bacterium]|nr:hypothetical protein [Rhodanobacteraceae bacterium]